jgi:hypothetical protein
VRPRNDDTRRPLPPSRRAPALQAAVAVGLPLVGFAVADDVRSGALASLGALAVLYAPGLPYRRRAIRVLGVGAGLVLAAAAGTAAAGSAAWTVGAIALVAGVSVALARWRSVGPPGALMPVLVCATSTQIPLAAATPASRLGLVALGVAIAWGVVMTRAPFRRPDPQIAAARRPAPPWPAIARAAGRGAMGTGVAALAAVAVGLPRPDWAAVACAAVLVHDATRTTVRRAGHRAAGTAAGIGVAGLLLAAAPGTVALVVLVVVLQFVVELLVARNYTAAVVFITPLALLQGALAGGHLAGPVAELLAGRMIETAIGCTVAVLAQAVVPPSGERPARAGSLEHPMRNGGGRTPLPDHVMPSPCAVRELERQAGDLYRRYGARPWSELPEGTREHFRGLVRAGLDGAGRPLV